VDDAAYRRYTFINLPHARTLSARIERSLEALGAFGEAGNGHAAPLREACSRLSRQLDPFDEDPPAEQALQAADGAAVQARALVDEIIAGPARGERLGQHVRNLFECLGLAEEGALLSLQCGERPDSPLR
jgi:hypothetical protein